MSSSLAVQSSTFRLPVGVLGGHPDKLKLEL
jgi:hypothetical protein